MEDAEGCNQMEKSQERGMTGGCSFSDSMGMRGTLLEHDIF